MFRGIIIPIVFFSGFVYADPSQQCVDRYKGQWKQVDNILSHLPLESCLSSKLYSQTLNQRQHINNVFLHENGLKPASYRKIFEDYHSIQEALSYCRAWMLTNADDESGLNRREWTRFLANLMGDSFFRYSDFEGVHPIISLSMRSMILKHISKVFNQYSFISSGLQIEPCADLNEVDEKKEKTVILADFTKEKLANILVKSEQALQIAKVFSEEKTSKFQKTLREHIRALKNPEDFFYFGMTSADHALTIQITDRQEGIKDRNGHKSPETVSLYIYNLGLGNNFHARSSDGTRVVYYPRVGKSKVKVKDLLDFVFLKKLQDLAQHISNPQVDSTYLVYSLFFRQLSGSHINELPETCEYVTPQQGGTCGYYVLPVFHKMVFSNLPEDKGRLNVDSLEFWIQSYSLNMYFKLFGDSLEDEEESLFRKSLTIYRNELAAITQELNVNKGFVEGPVIEYSLDLSERYDSVVKYKRDIKFQNINLNHPFVPPLDLSKEEVDKKNENQPFFDSSHLTELKIVENYQFHPQTFLKDLKDARIYLLSLENDKDKAFYLRRNWRPYFDIIKNLPLDRKFYRLLTASEIEEALNEIRIMMTLFTLKKEGISSSIPFHSFRSLQINLLTSAQILVERYIELEPELGRAIFGPFPPLLLSERLWSFLFDSPVHTNRYSGAPGNDFKNYISYEEDAEIAVLYGKLQDFYKNYEFKPFFMFDPKYPRSRRIFMNSHFMLNNHPEKDEWMALGALEWNFWPDINAVLNGLSFLRKKGFQVENKENDLGTVLTLLSEKKLPAVFYDAQAISFLGFRDFKKTYFLDDYTESPFKYSLMVHAKGGGISYAIEPNKFKCESDKYSIYDSLREEGEKKCLSKSVEEELIEMREPSWFYTLKGKFFHLLKRSKTGNVILESLGLGEVDRKLALASSSSHTSLTESLALFFNDPSLLEEHLKSLTTLIQTPGPLQEEYKRNPLIFRTINLFLKTNFYRYREHHPHLALVLLDNSEYVRKLYNEIGGQQSYSIEFINAKIELLKFLIEGLSSSSDIVPRLVTYYTNNHYFTNAHDLALFFYATFLSNMYYYDFRYEFTSLHDVFHALNQDKAEESVNLAARLLVPAAFPEEKIDRLSILRAILDKLESKSEFSYTHAPPKMGFLIFPHAVNLKRDPQIQFDFSLGSVFVRYGNHSGIASSFFGFAEGYFQGISTERNNIVIDVFNGDHDITFFSDKSGNTLRRIHPRKDSVIEKVIVIEKSIDGEFCSDFSEGFESFGVKLLNPKEYKAWKCGKSEEIKVQKGDVTEFIVKNDRVYRVLPEFKGNYPYFSNKKLLDREDKDFFNMLRENYEYWPWFNKEGQLVLIEIPRLNLTFKLNTKGDFESQEFPSYRLASKQIQGLNGRIKHGITLDSAKDSIYILPILEKRPGAVDNSVFVVKDTTYTRSQVIPYYVYKIDKYTHKPYSDERAARAYLNYVYFASQDYVSALNGLRNHNYNMGSLFDEEKSFGAKYLLWMIENKDSDPRAHALKIQGIRLLLSNSHQYSYTSTLKIEQIVEIFNRYLNVIDKIGETWLSNEEELETIQLIHSQFHEIDGLSKRVTQIRAKNSLLSSYMANTQMENLIPKARYIKNYIEQIDLKELSFYKDRKEPSSIRGSRFLDLIPRFAQFSLKIQNPVYLKELANLLSDLWVADKEYIQTLDFQTLQLMYVKALYLFQLDQTEYGRAMAELILNVALIAINGKPADLDIVPKNFGSPETTIDSDLIQSIRNRAWRFTQNSRVQYKSSNSDGSDLEMVYLSSPSVETLPRHEVRSAKDEKTEFKIHLVGPLLNDPLLNTADLDSIFTKVAGSIKEKDKLDNFLKELSSLESDRFRRDYVSGLRSDLIKYEALESASNYRVSSLSNLESLLKSLDNDLLQKKLIIEDTLNKIRGYVEKYKSGDERNILSALRWGGAIDLERDLNSLLTLLSWFNKDSLRSINVDLSIGENQDLVDHLFSLLLLRTWERHAKDLSKIGHGVLQLSSAGSESSPQLQVLINRFVNTAKIRRHYNIQEHPEYLVLEDQLGFVLRKNQVSSIESLLFQKDSALKVLELIMAAGKTSVIIPLLSHQALKSGDLMVLILPEHLIGSVSDQLENTFERVFGGKLDLLNVSRDGMNIDSIRQLHWRLNRDLEEKRLVILSNSSFLSLFLSFIDKLSDGVVDEAKELKKILALFKDKGHLLIDEVDEILNIKHSHLFAKSKQKPVELPIVLASFLCFGSMIDEFPGFVYPNKGEVFSDSHYASHQKPRLVDSIIKNSVNVFEILDPSQRSLIKQFSQLNKSSLRSFLTNTDTDENREKFLSSLMSDELRLFTATLYSLINKVLPFALTRVVNVGFGLYKRGPECEKYHCPEFLSIPYHLGQAMKKSRFANELEAMSFSLLANLQDEKPYGLISKKLTELLVRYRKGVPNEKVMILNELKYLVPQESLTSLLQEKGSISLNDKLLSAVHEDFLNHPLKFLKVLYSYLPDEIRVHASTLQTNSFIYPLLFKRIKGMSGTLWNHTSYPDYFDKIAFSDTQAKTLSLILDKVPDKVIVEPSASREEDRLKAMLNEHQSENIESLIDLGGLYKTLNNKRVAEILLQSGSHSKNKAVYYGEDGRQQILSKNGINRPYSNGNFDVQDICAFWDVEHTTGADITVSPYHHALLTINKNTNLRDFMQAGWRLRGLDHEQYFTIAISPYTQQVISERFGIPKEAIDKLAVLKFVISNEIQAIASDNIKGMNAALESPFIETFINKVFDKYCDVVCALEIYKEEGGSRFFEETRSHVYQAYSAREELRNKIDVVNSRKKHLLNSVFYTNLGDDEMEYIQNRLSSTIPKRLAGLEDKIQFSSLFGLGNELEVEAEEEQQQEQEAESEVENELTKEKEVSKEVESNALKENLVVEEHDWSEILFKRGSYFLGLVSNITEGPVIPLDELLKLKSNENIVRSFDTRIAVSNNLLPIALKKNFFQKFLTYFSKSKVDLSLFSQFQAEVGNILLVLDKNSDLIKVVLLDKEEVWTLGEWMQEMQSDSKGAGFQYVILNTGTRSVLRVSQEISVDELEQTERNLLNRKDIIAVMAQTRLLNGELTFTDDEKEALLEQFSGISREEWESFIKDVILKHKTTTLEKFRYSELWEILNKLEASQ